jgi:hypothetical protein
VAALGHVGSQSQVTLCDVPNFAVAVFSAFLRFRFHSIHHSSDDALPTTESAYSERYFIYVLTLEASSAYLPESLEAAASSILVVALCFTKKAVVSFVLFDTRCMRE